MKKLIAILLIASLAVSMVWSQGAQEDKLANYPDKPITLIVPWGVGGASDLLMRAVANVFPRYSGGQQLIIKNVNAAASVQGVVEYSGLRPDGYSLLFWATAQSIKTQMTKTPYEALDFEPIFATVNDSPYILVHADSPFKTLDDLVAYAKANPGELTMGNSGSGGGNHLAALQFEIAAGLDINHIPYGGGALSAQATLAREIDCSMNVPAEGLANVASGQLRMLAVLSRERMPAFPDAPTALEMGVDAVNEQARGIMIHRNAPEGMADKLAEIFKQCVEDPDFKKALVDLSMNRQWLDGPGYESLIEAEVELYKSIIQANRLGDRY